MFVILLLQTGSNFIANYRFKTLIHDDARRLINVDFLYAEIRNELRKYSQALAERPELVVANKMDLTGSEASLRRFQDAVATEVIPISAVTGRGLNVLAERIWQMLQEDQPPAD